ncbi:AmmeMemoRadiSam system protein A [bacterium]|nr:AmmeMemoRadiSam system protein A [bacterium]
MARESVETYIKEGKIPEFSEDNPMLNQKLGAFVTIKKHGKLRGCIGEFSPTKEPLYKVVSKMAIAAATKDIRFSPVKEEELDELEYEVSVLSEPQKIDNWRKIELGKHGVIIRQSLNQGVFLPQVADETGWSLEKFLSELCFQKAGLPPDCYKDKNTEIYTFTAKVFSEE